MTPREAAYASAARELRAMSTSELVHALLASRLKAWVRRALEATDPLPKLDDRGVIELKHRDGAWPARLLIVQGAKPAAAWVSFSPASGELAVWSGRPAEGWRSPERMSLASSPPISAPAATPPAAAGA